MSAPSLFHRLARHARWVSAWNALLLGLWLGAAMAIYRHLPGQIPMHFDLSGEPTRWEPTTHLRWLALPLIAAALLAGTLVAGWLRRSSETLPGSHVRLLYAYLNLCGTLLILALGLVHFGILWVALERWEALPGWLLVAAVGLAAGTLLLIIPLQRAERNTGIHG
jgi:hypothetical protein